MHSLHSQHLTFRKETLTESPSYRSIITLTTTNMSNFLSLPSELRNRIYELCLLQPEPIEPIEPIELIKRMVSLFNRRQESAVGIFRTNKVIYREASSLFYAQNHFDFTMATSSQVASFLKTIGRNNSDHIRHIHISFPEFLNLDAGNVTLDDDSIGLLASIRDGCNNLGTLTTSLDSTQAMRRRLDTLDDPKRVDEALGLVNTSFRDIASLQEIIVEVYQDSPCDDIRRKMESYGWTIDVTENVEEWDEGHLDYMPEEGWDSDFDYDYGYSHGYDEYDIDNDSDFWRRAGD